MLSVANKPLKLSVIMLNVVMLSVVILRVVMMNVVLLNVLAPNTVQDIMRRHHLRFSQKNSLMSMHLKASCRHDHLQF
jgi:hypothetical protein